MINIIHGDFLEVSKFFVDNSFGVCVTSPPYNIGIKYDGGEDNMVDYEDWTMLWLAEALRLSKKGVMLNIDTKASDQTRLYVLLGKIAKKHVEIAKKSLTA